MKTYISMLWNRFFPVDNSYTQEDWIW